MAEACWIFRALLDNALWGWDPNGEGSGFLVEWYEHVVLAHEKRKSVYVYAYASVNLVHHFKV